MSEKVSIDKALAELDAATRLHDNAKHELEAARRLETAALNRLNEAQKTVDVLFAELRKSANRDSDWWCRERAEPVKA